MGTLEQARTDPGYCGEGTDGTRRAGAKAAIERRWVGLLLVLSALTLAALIHPALKTPMIYDSQGFIAAKAHLFQAGLRDTLSITPIRPLFMVTLYLNYLTTGMDPLYFRLVNIALSAGAGTALAVMIFLILEIGGAANDSSTRQRLEVSLFLGFVYAIHPLQTLVTLYIWQREATLACLLYFSSVAVYLAARSGRFRSPATGYGLTGVLFLAGMLCKENMVTVPAVLFLADAVLLRGTVKDLGRSAVRVAAIVILPLILYFAATYSFAGSESRELHSVVKRLSGYYEHAGLSLGRVLLTESRVLFAYLATIVFPIPGSIDLIKSMTVSRSLFSPPVTLAACAGTVALAATAVFVIRRRPITAFGILFFVISLIPESTLIPPYLFFGYRAILPMAGLLMILGEVMLRILNREHMGGGVGSPRVILGCVSALVLVGLATVTHLQAVSWNPLSFWKEAYEKLPADRASIEPKPYLDIVSNLAGLLAGRGDMAGAERLSREALALYPNALELHDTLGLALLHRGRVSEAIAEFREAVRLQPTSVGALNNLGNALLAADRVPEAIEVFRRAIGIQPTRVQPYVNLGAAYANSGEYEKAREVLREAVRLNPGYAKAQANLGITLVNLGRYGEAVEHLSNAVKLDPRPAGVHLQLGIAWDRSGDTIRAVESYERALHLVPTFNDARIHLAGAFKRLGRYPESIAQYQRILEIDPKNYKAHNDLASVFIITSQYGKAIHHCRRALSLNPDFSEAKRNLKTATELAEADTAVQL
ncbi:MAG: tetratricopeptide repeat protein [Pseudomonadota bacterium]